MLFCLSFSFGNTTQINVPNGASQNIPGDYPAGDFSGGTIAAGGSLSNSDELNNTDTLTNDGSLFNSGTLTNTASGTLDNNASLHNSMGTLTNEGTLNNTVTGTLNNNAALMNDGILDNNGTLENTVQGTLNNNNIVTNNGILNNSGTVTNNSTLENNNQLNNNNLGTLDNSGTLRNNNFFTNRGTLNNTGTLENTGTLTNNIGATVNIGTGGNSGTLSGNITNQGSLTFNRSDDSSYTDIISGNGSLTKSGTGTLTLSRSNTYGGPTTVNDGTLKVTGSISSSSLTTINSGATISGTGTVGALTINSGGFIVPGDGLGTINVNSSYIQHGIYNCEVQAATTPTPGTDNDFININGPANITNGTLNVIPLAGNYGAGQTYTYTILSSTALTGPFAAVTGTSPLFTYTVTYDTHHAYVHLLPLKKSEPVISIGNPGQVASYVNSNGSQALINQLNPLTTSQLKQAFNQLSPAASTQVSDMTANAELGHMDAPFTWLHRDQLLKSMGEAAGQLMSNLTRFKQSFAQLFASKLNHKKLGFGLSEDTAAKHFPTSAQVNLSEKARLWIQGTVSQLSQANIADPSRLSVQGLDGTTYDTNIGIDYALSSKLKLGLISGYGYSTYKMKVGGDKGNKNSARIGLYVLGESNAADYIKGAVYYGHHRFKGDRVMTIIPAIAHQKHTGNHMSGLVEIGRNMGLKKDLTLTPYISGGVLYLQENKYNETGPGVQNLAVRRRHNTTWQGKAGAQLTNFWKWNEGTPFYTFAKLGLTYRKARHKKQTVTASLINQGGQFVVVTKNKHRWLANPSIGATVSIFNNTHISMAYEGEVGSTQRYHQTMAQIMWTF
ncbi:MAG: autotransporter domain-containing protein [Candidatus Paracaedibacteraceae bacterium]|nr:autotransporter domain-containing protein [Candidatus Paracaedibacteraceae bacterium]